LGGKEVGGLLVINPTVLKEKNMEKQKEYNLPDSERTNATKTVSDVFRHRSRTGKSYCRTRSDVGSERVKNYAINSFIIFSHLVIILG
jgi:hypothetical protein